MLAVLADAQLGLLELVDLLVDALEATVVGGAEVLSAGDGSDVPQRPSAIPQPTSSSPRPTPWC